MNIISVKGLSKFIGSKGILKDISFELGEGEIVSLLGSSGAGKSTLLSCVAQLITPDYGTINVNNNLFTYPCKSLVKNLMKLKGSMGMVFQNNELWPHMNVFNNLTLAPSKVFNWSQDYLKKEAIQWLERLKLIDKLESYPSELSGGERQRVAICKALMMKPKVILFDEPTSALDPKTVVLVKEVFKELSEQKVAILFTTHDIRLACEMAHRVLFLSENQLVDDQKIENKIIRPNHAKFKTFLDPVIGEVSYETNLAKNIEC